MNQTFHSLISGIMHKGPIRCFIIIFDSGVILRYGMKQEKMAFFFQQWVTVFACPFTVKQMNREQWIIHCIECSKLF